MAKLFNHNIREILRQAWRLRIGKNRLSEMDIALQEVDPENILEHERVHAQGLWLYKMFVVFARGELEHAERDLRKYLSGLRTKAARVVRAETAAKRPTNDEIENALFELEDKELDRLQLIVTRKKRRFAFYEAWYDAWVSKGFKLTDVKDLLRRSQEI